MSFKAPAPFDPARHSVESFDCGREQLDAWLRAFAGQGQRRDASRTYVLVGTRGDVVGYYTLVAAQLAYAEVTPAVQKGMSKHFPIPVVLLARLAIDRQHQGEGLGAALLIDAMQRVVRVADQIGIRAVAIDALDEMAAAFYRRFGLEALTDDGLVLMATIAQLRAASHGE